MENQYADLSLSFIEADVKDSEEYCSRIIKSFFKEQDRKISILDNLPLKKSRTCGRASYVIDIENIEERPWLHVFRANQEGFDNMRTTEDLLADDFSIKTPHFAMMNRIFKDIADMSRNYNLPQRLRICKLTGVFLLILGLAYFILALLKISSSKLLQATLFGIILLTEILLILLIRKFKKSFRLRFINMIEFYNNEYFYKKNCRLIVPFRGPLFLMMYLPEKVPYKMRNKDFDDKSYRIRASSDIFNVRTTGDEEDLSPPPLKNFSSAESYLLDRAGFKLGSGVKDRQEDKREQSTALQIENDQ